MGTMVRNKIYDLYLRSEIRQTQNKTVKSYFVKNWTTWN